jgi:acetoacetate decarboxylase
MLSAAIADLTRRYFDMPQALDPFFAGFDAPVTGPLYPHPPYYYRDAQVVLGIYQADSERVARHLPPGVLPASDPATCIAWVCHYPFTTFGSYNEAIMLVQVEFEGETHLFCPFIYLDSDAPMAAGRELWGWPKKLAHCGQENSGPGPGDREGLCFAVERPAGKRLLTVTMTPERPATMEDVGATPHLTLRYIPGAEAGSAPSVCELIRTEPETAPRLAADGSPEIWTGRCQVSVDSPSASDPLQDLAPTAMLGGIYGVFDWTLPQGRVVKDYLAEAREELPAETQEVGV